MTKRLYPFSLLVLIGDCCCATSTVRVCLYTLAEDDDEDGDEEENEEEADNGDPEEEMKEKIDASTGAKQTFEDKVEYSADEKIEVDLDNDLTRMFVNAQIKYGTYNILAHEIDVNFNSQYISAFGKPWKKYGYYDPRVFAQIDKMALFADKFRINIHSKRAKGDKVLLLIHDMLARSDKAKKDVEDTYYAQDLFLTTCNLPEPHYGITIEKSKFKQNKGVVGENAHMVFDGVQVPIKVPFAMFLFPKDKHSGFLFPHFGENSNGFYISDGGYYFYFNDYIDLALRASIYTKGNINFRANSKYIKRYSFKGDVSYEISNHTKYVDKFNTRNVKETDDWIFKWKHMTTNSKVRQFTIDIDYHGTSPADSALVPSTDEAKQKQQTCKSTIKYSDQQVLWGYYALNSTIDFSKDFSTNITQLTLPQVSLSSVPLHIFRFGRKRAKYFWDDITVKHSVEFIWRTSNQNKENGTVDDPYPAKKAEKAKPSQAFDFSWKNRKRIFDNASSGIKQTLPISMNIKILKYFNLKPFINFTSRFYFTRRTYKDGGQYEENHGLFHVWDYNTGTELQTTIYGTILNSNTAKIIALRHRIEPVINFTYTPDMSYDWLGFYQKFGETKYNRYAGAVFGNAPDHRSAVISIKCNNVLEMKVNKIDGSVAKIPAIESFSWDTGYDFLAPRFNMKDINYSVKTTIGWFQITYSATIDPYYHAQNANGSRQKINEFAWNHGEYLGNISKSSLIISTSFMSKDLENKEKQAKEQENRRRKKQQEEQKEEYVKDEDEELTEDDYAPFYPLKTWKIGLSFHRDYTRDLDTLIEKATHTLNISPELRLTKSWTINASFVFDLDIEDFKHDSTRFGAICDLHCWVLNFNMSPFAKEISYDFSVGIKSSSLSDVKIPHTNKYKRV